MLAGIGELEEAQRVASSQLDDAARFRLAFVVPYAHIIESVVALMLGQFERATNLIEEIERSGQAIGDDLLISNAVALRSLALVSKGCYRDAVAASMKTVGQALPSAHGELLACRAIALACDRQDELALRTANGALQASRASEAVVGSSVARAIVAANREDEDTYELARAALRLARVLSEMKFFVSAYRAVPRR
jgi:hypothetical protein